MNLKAVKRETDVQLAGITVEIERHDGSAMGVTLRDAAGGMLVIKQGPYSSLNVFVPAPPPMVKRWRISGELKGIKFEELFEEQYKAVARLNELEVEGTPEEVEVPE